MTQRTKHFRLFTLVGILAITAFAIVGVGTLLWWWSKNTSQSQIAHSLNSAKPYLTLWRLTVIVMIVAAWPTLIQWIARRGQWSATLTQSWLAWRWRAAFWLVALELLFSQNIIQRTISIVTTER